MSSRLMVINKILYRRYNITTSVLKDCDSLRVLCAKKVPYNSPPSSMLSPPRTPSFLSVTCFHQAERKATTLHSCCFRIFLFLSSDYIVTAKGSYSVTRSRSIDRMQIRDLYVSKHAYCEHTFLSSIFVRDKK